jgi:hypothetical protein
MSVLAEIIQQIKDKKALLAVEPEKVDPQVRATFEGQQRSAQAELAVLEEKYKNEVMKHVVLIEVKGPGAKSFVETAKEVAITVNYNQVVEDLEAALKSRLAPEPYDSNTHFVLLEELQKLKIKENILILPMPVINAYNDEIYGSSIKVALMRMFKKNYGGSLESAIARKQIGSIALQSEFKGKRVPVFIYNVVGPIDNSFLPQPVTSTSIEEENVDIETVKSKLKEIKSALK